MNSNDRAWLTLEQWKKVVEVQQHFNDLELRIRNFALIITGAFLAFGGGTASTGVISQSAFGISVTGIIVWAALLPLFAFYFMDRFWYHRLLHGSVMAGIELERRMAECEIPSPLGKSIKDASPFKILGREVHSDHKIDIFYAILALSIMITGLIIVLSFDPPGTLRYELWEA